MINPVVYTTVPNFGGAASQVQPSSPDPYVNGYLAGQQLPAEHFNWFLAGLTGNNNLTQDALNHLVAEGDNLVVGAGLAVVPGDDTQVLQATKIISGGSVASINATPYTITAGTTDKVFLITTGASNFTINLPSVASGQYDFLFIKVDSGAGYADLVRAGGDTFDAGGAASIRLYSQGDRVAVRNDGVGIWWQKPSNQAITKTLLAADFPFSTPVLPTSLTLICNSAGTKALDISNGAYVAGTLLRIHNIHATGIVTIQTAAGKVSTMGSGCVSLVWDGANWDFSATMPTAYLSSTPYTLDGTDFKRLFSVTTGAGAFVFNLPAAATFVGLGPITIVKADSGAGAVQVAPNGTDAIGQAGNVSCYLGFQYQHITLLATASGQWSVTSGVISADATHYELGKLHHLPLGNTTNREIYNGAAPAQGAWSTAKQATGVAGIPAGAKALRARILFYASPSAGGSATFTVAVSDNNSNTPSQSTAHPQVEIEWYAAAVGNSTVHTQELDIPLNSSGQFYIYTITLDNVGLTIFGVYAVGYYMGD